MHVVTHVAHLPSKQIGKGRTIGDRIVVAILLLREQSIRHFPPYWKIDVMHS